MAELPAKPGSDRQSRSGIGRMGQAEASDAEAEMRVGWRMAGLAFAVASEVAAGTILGYFADRMLGTAPVWTTVGAGLGISVSLYGLIRGALKLNRELDRTNRSRPLPPPISDDEWDRDSSGLAFDTQDKSEGPPKPPNARPTDSDERRHHGPTRR